MSELQTKKELPEGFLVFVACGGALVSLLLCGIALLGSAISSLELFQWLFFIALIGFLGFSIALGVMVFASLMSWE